MFKANKNDQSLKSTIDKLRDSQKSLLSRIDVLKNIIKDLKSKIQLKVDQIKKMSNTIKKLNNDISMLKSKVVLKNKALSRIESQKKALQFRVHHGGDAKAWNEVNNMDLFWSNDEKNNIYQNFGKNLSNFLEKELPVKTFNSILDMGCGSGDVTYALLSAFKCKKLYAFDFSESSVEISQERLKSLHIPFECRTQNIYELEGEFDFILCTEVIEHLELPGLAIQKLLASLSKNGYLVITVPDGRMDRSPGHINFWSQESFETFIKAHVKSVDCNISIHKEFFNKTKDLEDLVGNLVCIINHK